MSQITANTVLFYSGDASHRPLVDELPLDGADKLFKGIRFPESGVTFLYGHRNPAIPYFLEQAANIGLDAAIVDIHVDIGKWVRQKVDFSDDPERGLKHIHFLSVIRAKREITTHIEKVWVRALGSEIASQEDWPLGGTRHPYLLDTLHREPEFNHLKAIAYTLSTAELGPVQAVTVFDLDAIVTYKTEHNLDGVELVL